MAISNASGFHIGSSDAIDDRLVLTKEQMKAANDNVYPDVYMTLCVDDGYLYIYNKSNESDIETGKFRKFESGGGSIETELRTLTQNNVNGNTGLPVSDSAIKNIMAAENGLATLDANGKLKVDQLPTSTRYIVGHINASTDHALPDEENYHDGNEIIIQGSGYVIQSTAFTLTAEKTLTNFEVGNANQLIQYGYVFTLVSEDGTINGVASLFSTNKITFNDGSEVALPYTSDISATSQPAVVQTPVYAGDSFILVDEHWAYIGGANGVTSVNDRIGAVTVQEYDVENKEQLAKISESDNMLAYNGKKLALESSLGTQCTFELSGTTLNITTL